MAVIKYTLVNSATPSYITDGGYYRDDSDNTYIGIGSGGGTEMSKAEVVARYQRLGSTYYDTDPDALNEFEPGFEPRAATDAELEAAVNSWYTARGIS